MPDLPHWPWCSDRPRSLERAQASVAFLMSLRSLAMRLKDDMVDGPRLVPPVIQWARRAFLERAEEGLSGLFVLLDILGCGRSTRVVVWDYLVSLVLLPPGFGLRACENGWIFSADILPENRHDISNLILLLIE